MNWDADTRKMLDFAGRKFISTQDGLRYLFQAEDWIGSRNDDRKPFLMAKPIQRLDKTSNPGRPRSRMVVFHAEHLPEKPEP